MYWDVALSPARRIESGIERIVSRAHWRVAKSVGVMLNVWSEVGVVMFGGRVSRRARDRPIGDLSIARAEIIEELR
jgi:hypothetical protein